MSNNPASSYKHASVVPWRSLGQDVVRNQYPLAVKSIADPKTSEGLDVKEGIPLIEAVLSAHQPKNNVWLQVPAFVADLATVIDRYAGLANEQSWRRILYVLRAIDDKFNPGKRVLTVAASWAMQLAYQHSFPAAVAKHLEAPILSVLPSYTGTNTEHYSRYFYYAGLIQAEYSRFDEAHALFETAIEVNNISTESSCALSANKALFIVSAVAKQEIASVAIPAFTNSVSVYKGFAEAYLERPHQLSAYRQEIAKDSKDLNRLAGLVCDNKVANQILEFTKVYTNIPLSDIAKSVGLQKNEIRAKIDFLVSSGRVGAEIDANDVVYFSDVDHSSHEQVEEAIDRAIALSDHLESVQTQVEVSKDFIRSRDDFKIRLEKEIALAAAGGGF